MRRGLSLFFALLFGLGPLALLRPDSDDASLPACCRRHGAHHCAMSARLAEMAAQAAAGKSDFLAAPSTCPQFPAVDSTSTLPVHALIVSPAAQPIPSPQPRFALAIRAAAPQAPCQTRSTRAPPSPFQA